MSQILQQQFNSNFSATSATSLAQLSVGTNYMATNILTMAIFQRYLDTPKITKEIAGAMHFKALCLS